MKKITVLLFGILSLLTLGGCSNEKTYNSVDNENGEVKLIIKEDEFTMDFVTLNKLLEDDGYSEYTIHLKGTIDKKTNEFKFNTPKNPDIDEPLINEKFASKYKMKDKCIKLEFDDETFTFYPESNKKYNELVKRFNKETGGKPDYYNSALFFIKKNELGEYLDDDDSDNENHEQSNSDINGFSKAEIEETAENILQDYMNIIEGHWIGKPINSDISLEASVDIKSDQTFTATYIAGKETYSSGVTKINYSGNYKTTSATLLNITTQINELIKSEEISNLDEISTYPDFADIAGEYSSRIELIFTISTNGVKYIGKSNEEKVSSTNKEKILNLNYYDGEINFNELFDVVQFASFSK